MTSTPDTEIPFFPAAAPAALADPATAHDLLRPVLDDLAAVVATAAGRDPSSATPCRGYDLAALLDHVLGWLDLFGVAFADPARRGERPDPQAFRATRRSGDPAEVVRAAADRFDAAFAAGVLDGEVVMSQSRMSGPAALGMVLGEYVVHGHDLAVATGQAWTPSRAAVAASHEFFAGIVTPQYRGPEGFFDAEVPVPDDASPLDRLLGFAGRDPGWAPPA